MGLQPTDMGLQPMGLPLRSPCVYNPQTFGSTTYSPWVYNPQALGSTIHNPWVYNVFIRRSFSALSGLEVLDGRVCSIATSGRVFMSEMPSDRGQTKQALTLALCR